MNLKIKYSLIVVGFLLLAVVGYCLLPNNKEVENKAMENTDTDIYVHIDGAVKNPGLLKVAYGTRLYELIEEAGGETEDADLSRVNLSCILNDEQKIVIPKKVVISEESISSSNGLININTATKEELMQLNGVGEGTAKKIIHYREENGYFNTIEDLKNVSGIGDNKFNGLKDEITT